MSGEQVRNGTSEPAPAACPSEAVSTLVLQDRSCESFRKRQGKEMSRNEACFLVQLNMGIDYEGVQGMNSKSLLTATCTWADNLGWANSSSPSSSHSQLPRVSPGSQGKDLT